MTYTDPTAAAAQFDPAGPPGVGDPYGTSTGTTSLGGTPKYLGNVAHARVRTKDLTPQGASISFMGPGYVKGDQVKLLPKNGGDLGALQQALYQAGYITKDAFQRMVLGSPDDVTSAAFAKLLATANVSGVEWRDALSARLATAAALAPAGLGPQADSGGKQVPPLTVSLIDPMAVKSVIQDTAKTLTGGAWDDNDVNQLVASFQAQQRQAQTKQYYQQYDPTGGGYGPGGETVQPDQTALTQEAKDALIKAHPANAAVATFSNNLSTIMGALNPHPIA